MSSHDDIHSGEMTDTRLDQLLAAANRELLDHVEATADSHRALTAIMTRSTQEAPSPQTTAPAISHDPDQPWAALMITMRVRARDLGRALDRTLHLALYRAHGLGLDDISELTRRLGGTRRLAHGLGRDPNLVSDLIRDLNLGRELISELGSEFDLARDLAHDLAHDLDLGHTRADRRALGRALDLGRSLNMALDRAFDPAPRLRSDLIRDLIINLGRDLISDLGRTLGSEIISELGSASDLARDLARDLDAQQVDASGADLSGLEIRHLDVLDEIIWTRQTTWPPRIADQIEARSEEIRPGYTRYISGIRQIAMP